MYKWLNFGDELARCTVLKQLYGNSQLVVYQGNFAS
jgi:hypothetical protein